MICLSFTVKKEDLIEIASLPLPQRICIFPANKYNKNIRQNMKIRKKDRFQREYRCWALAYIAGKNEKRSNHLLQIKAEYQGVVSFRISKH